MALYSAPLGGKLYPRPNSSCTTGWAPEPTFAVPAGLPQGSPVSPILFMLYIEPIFKIGPTITRRGRFGYADDIYQLVVSKTLAENTIKLQEITADLLAWGCMSRSRGAR